MFIDFHMFLLYLHRFPIVFQSFPRFSYAFLGFRMNYEVFLGFHILPYVFLDLHHMFPLGFPWISFRFSLDSPLHLN